MIETISPGPSIMHDPLRFFRAPLGALTAVLTVLIGCAPPIVLDNTAIVANAISPTLTDLSTEASEPPTIELRYFSFSPTVSVVGWAGDDAGYGLRTYVRRDGSLVRDHRLYVSTYYGPAMRSYYLAHVRPRGLEMLGVSRDPLACYWGRCSPFETMSVRIPDELLRSNRDSLDVTFLGHGNRKLVLTLRRDLIDAYLTAVDSVSAEMRRLRY